MYPIKYTKELLAEWRVKARSNFAWFHTNILGSELPTQHHINLCNQLQGIDPEMGPWTRLCVCWARSVGLKTTLDMRWLLWRGLCDPGFSSLVVERKVGNAVAHVNEKVYQLFEDDRYAMPMLRAVFPERIPAGRFWTNEGFSLAGCLPDTPLTVGCIGLDGSHEGKHTKVVLCEDLEGADANVSEVPNKVAWDFVAKAQWLLIEPQQHQILVVGTPHGADPLVYRIRNLEGEGADEGTLDNSKRRLWKISWQPVLDKKTGEPFWPERTPQEWLDLQIRQAAKDPRLKEELMTQYFLERGESGASFFDSNEIDACNYEIVGSQTLAYPAREFKIDRRTGELTWEDKTKICPIRQCWFYIHVDPKHRQKVKNLRSSDRKAAWAFVVVAVTPDFHRFVIEATAHDQYSSTEGLDHFVELYRKYAPRYWTFETIGAQVWFIDSLQRMEKRGQLIHVTSSGKAAWDRTVRTLPKPSLRVVEIESLEKKEDRIYDRLSPLFSYRWLHLHVTKGVELRTHLLRIGTESKEAIDLADALAQGPDVWTPPWSPEKKKAMAIQQAITERMQAGTLYAPPWATPHQPSL